MVQTIHVAVDG